MDRDLIMMGMMETLGYQHGEAFEPAAPARAMLLEAVESALEREGLTIAE